MRRDLNRRLGRWWGLFRSCGLGFVSCFHNPCYAQQLVRFREGNEFDAFRAATGLADFFDPGANTLALGGEKHDLVVVADAECAGDFDRAIFREIDGDYPGTAAASQTVVFKRGALANAVLASHEQARGRIANLDRLQEISTEFEAHAGDTDGVATHGSKAFGLFRRCPGNG